MSSSIKFPTLDRGRSTANSYSTMRSFSCLCLFFHCMAAKRKARDDVHDAPRKESRIEIGRGFVCHIVDAYGMDETFSKVYKVSGLSEEAYGIIYTELEKARDKCNAYFKDDEGAPKVDHRISAFSFMEHPIRYLCGDLV